MKGDSALFKKLIPYLKRDKWLYIAAMALAPYQCCHGRHPTLDAATHN